MPAHPDPPPALSAPVLVPGGLRPDCPRCGYDQSGAVAAWHDVCLLEGVCPECGLSFRWSEVLALNIVDEQGKYEFSQPRLGRALVNTWRRSFLPWRFWTWMRMSEPVRPRRLVRYGVLASILSYLVVSVAAAAAWLAGPFVAIRLVGRVGPGDLESYLAHGAACDVWFCGAPVVPTRSSDSWEWRVLLLVWIVLVPFTYRLVGATLARTSILPKHLWRVGIYTAATVPAVLGGFFVVASFGYAGAWVFEYMSAGGPPNWGLSYHMSGGTTSRIDALTRHRWSLGVPLIGAWLVLCQGFALKRYLKIPHPWFVACTLTFVSGLAAFACVLIPSDYHWFADRWALF